MVMMMIMKTTTTMATMMMTTTIMSEMIAWVQPKFILYEPDLLSLEKNKLFYDPVCFV